MIYKLGRRSDMDALPPMQDKIRNIISEQLNILTKYYGADRDIDHDDGGYVLYATPGTSKEDIKAVFDYSKYLTEYVILHRKTEPLTCSSLYLLHNDFGVVLVMALQDIPEEYLKEIEGDT